MVPRKNIDPPSDRPFSGPEIVWFRQLKQTVERWSWALGVLNKTLKYVVFASAFLLAAKGITDIAKGIFT